MSRILLIVAAACWCGCAAPLDPPGVLTPDAEPPVDTAPAETTGNATPLFTKCGGDEDCLGTPGALCLTNYPGGLCTHRCDGSGECVVAGRAGRCIANVCLPSCGAGVDCASVGGGCVQRIEISAPFGNYCAPTCFGAERTPASRPKCVDGTVCDEHANTCVAELRTKGAANGAPCRDPEECLGGSCLPGYSDGYCRSLALLPDPSEFAAGKPLPRSSCPEGSVVVPVFGAGVRAGSLTWCWRSCSTAGDCRSGYTCRFIDEHTTGYCAPTDCALDQTCPSDHACKGDRCTK